MATDARTPFDGLDPITDEIISCGCECHAGKDRS